MMMTKMQITEPFAFIHDHGGQQGRNGSNNYDGHHQDGYDDDGGYEDNWL